MPDIHAIIGEPFRHEIVERMPWDQYREANGLNPSSIASGVLNEFSPLYVRHSYETDSTPTDIMVQGTFGHCMLLEPQHIDERFAIWDGGTRRGKDWDAFKERHEGCQIVRGVAVDIVSSAVESALRRQNVRDLIGNGVAEVSVFSSDAGLQVKGRLDWVNTDTATPVDVKFTNDIRPHKFGRVASSLAYTVKLGCYQRWFARERGIKLRPFQMLVIQLNEKRPHDCCIVPVAEADLDYGWNKAEKMLGIVRDSIRSGEWPGIDGGADYVPLMVPTWEMPEETEEFDG